jgi:hypothetical protein
LSGGSAKPLNLKLLARHKGRQFRLDLRAVKQGAGLVQTTEPLAIGDKLILHIPSQTGERGTLQLFSSVARVYQERAAYALRWEKLVSPTGTTALMEFLQSSLGVCISPETAMAEEFVDGEMVYYDFGDQELHLPNRGRVVGRNTPSHMTPAPGGPDDFGHGPRTGPVTGGFTGPIMDNLTPPVTGRTTGRVGDGNGYHRPADSLEARAREAARSAEQQGRPFYEEGEEVVEMFGMKVSKENWDRLERLNYGGGSSTASAPPGKTSPAPSERPNRPAPGTSASGSGEAENGPAGRSKMAMFLRKIADKLSDK